VHARIGPASRSVASHGKSREVWLALAFVTSMLAGCGLFGAEITVDARNDGDLDMTVQVIDANGAPNGPAHRLEPLEERELELAIPAGAWAVTVNGAIVLESEQAQGRTGRLPVTLVSPAPDDPAAGPYGVWEQPGS
jgi:hypothetical protein